MACDPETLAWIFWLSVLGLFLNGGSIILRAIERRRMAEPPCQEQPE
jgi:hypothetical protein